MRAGWYEVRNGPRDGHVWWAYFFSRFYGWSNATPVRPGDTPFHGYQHRYTWRGVTQP